jgi:hypothetical protein
MVEVLYRNEGSVDLAKPERYPQNNFDKRRIFRYLDRKMKAVGHNFHRLSFLFGGFVPPISAKTNVFASIVIAMCIYLSCHND